jgi:hypothetical protein
MVTDCGSEYVPAAGEKVGVAACVVDPGVEGVVDPSVKLNESI